MLYLFPFYRAIEIRVKCFFHQAFHRYFFLDVGANLTDSMYQGIYNGSQKHQPDLDKVLERSWNNNLSKIIITAGSLEESKKALEIAKTDGASFENYLLVITLPVHCLYFYYFCSELQTDYFPLWAVIRRDVMSSKSRVIQKRILTLCANWLSTTKTKS